MLDIQMLDDIAVVRPAGRWQFTEVVNGIGKAIEAVCARGVRLMLVDTTGLSGFGSPSLAERAALARHWAAVANGRVQIAMLAPVEFIDPDRFGVIVAANYGLTSAAFTNEADALAWLREVR